MPARLAAAEAAAARDAGVAGAGLLCPSSRSGAPSWSGCRCSGAFVQGATGLRYGLVVAPALFAVLEPRQALYAVLLSALVLNGLMLVGSRPVVRTRAAGTVLSGRCPGFVAGAALVGYISRSHLQVAVGHRRGARGAGARLASGRWPPTPAAPLGHPGRCRAGLRPADDDDLGQRAAARAVPRRGERPVGGHRHRLARRREDRLRHGHDLPGSAARVARTAAGGGQQDEDEQRGKREEAHRPNATGDPPGRSRHRSRR